MMVLVGDTGEVAPNVIGGAQYLSALIGVVLPIISALITKRSHSPKQKAILLLVLSVASGFVTEWLNSTNFVWQQALFGSLLALVTGVATLFGLWKPTGVNDAAQNTLVTDKRAA